jgi:hypothetical protein
MTASIRTVALMTAAFVVLVLALAPVRRGATVASTA